ncbi:MAG: leucine-rich repeat protein, partial [Metamycoplasmataceae bacterium]
MNIIKNKIYLSLLVPLSILPIALTACSSSNEEQEQVVVFVKDGLRITTKGVVIGYTNDLVIDKTLLIQEQYDDVVITQIGDSAFKDNQDIEELILPTTLRSIGVSAFQNSNITSVNLFDLPLLATIGVNAFQNNKLTSLHVNDTTTEIGSNAFKDNDFSFLSSIRLPAILDTETHRTRIGIILKDYIDTEMFRISSKGEILGFVEGVTIHPILSIAESYNDITIQGIGKDAFANLEVLTHIYLPPQVTTIGENAFSNNNISHINFDTNQVRDIGKNAFRNNNLITLSLPNTVSNINDNAFADNKITSLTIDNQNIFVWNDVFLNNDFLSDSEIILPSKLNNAAERRRIGIIIKEVTETVVEGLRISSEGKIMGFDGTPPSTTLEIKENYNGIQIKSIADNAFEGKQLTNIVFPDIPIKIGRLAFTNNALSSLTI